MATITVGQDKFCVHENLICQHSGYFKAAFSGATDEHATRRITLNNMLEECSGMFGTFVHWLYYQEVEIANEQTGVTIMDDWRRSCILMVNAWGLGSKLLAPRFQNDVMNELFKIVPRLDAHSLAAVVQATPKSMFRKPYQLLMDHIGLGLSTKAVLAILDPLNDFVGCDEVPTDIIIVLKDYQMNIIDDEAATAESYHVPLPVVKQEGTSKAQAGS